MWNSRTQYARVLDEVAAHARGVGAVEVDRAAPRRLVAVGEVRARTRRGSCPPGRGGCRRRRGRPTSPRAWQASTRRRSPRGPAVGRLRRVQVDAVVAPVARARELGRPASARSRSRRARPAAARCGMTASKVPGGGEGADVQLVEHQVGQRVAAEALVGPREARAGRRRPTARARPRAASARPDRAGSARRRAGTDTACPAAMPGTRQLEHPVVARARAASDGRPSMTTSTDRQRGRPHPERGAVSLSVAPR